MSAALITPELSSASELISSASVSLRPIETETTAATDFEQITTVPEKSGVEASRTSQHRGDTPPGYTWVAEHWDSIESIDARIISADDYYVTLECIINPLTREIEEREFDRRLFDGWVPVRFHQYISLRMMQRPGKVTYVISDASKRSEEISRIFDLAEPFRDFDATAFLDEI